MDQAAWVRWVDDGELPPEPDPLEEALAAAGIGLAPTPKHWQAIERTNDFETQQKATRAALARLSDEWLDLGGLPSENAMSFGADPERQVWAPGFPVPRGGIRFARINGLAPDPGALVQSVDLTGFVGRVAMSFDLDPDWWKGDDPTSMRQAVARRRKAEQTKSRDRARDAIKRGRRTR